MSTHINTATPSSVVNCKMNYMVFLASMIVNKHGGLFQREKASQ